MTELTSIKSFIEEGETIVQKRGKVKLTKIPQKNTTDSLLERVSRGKVGILLIPVLLFELFVCIQGFNYYHNFLGFSALGAISVSLCVECFYMYYSSKEGDYRKTVMKYLFLCISIFTLAFSTYTTDNNLKAYKEGIETSKVKLSEKLAQLEKQVEMNNSERSQIDEQMSVYLKRELITKGNRVLGPRRKEIDQNLKSLMLQQESTRVKLSSISSNSSSIPIIKQIEIMTVKTIVTIIVFALIQIAICISLAEIILSFKNSPEKYNKIK
jgi:hypothetical protein